MITFTFFGFTFAVYASHTVITIVIDIILNITFQTFNIHILHIDSRILKLFSKEERLNYQQEISVTTL